MESLETFEKAKCQSFISIILSVNYLMLYAVVLAPFILIAIRTSPEEEGMEDGVETTQPLPTDFTDELAEDLDEYMTTE